MKQLNIFKGIVCLTFLLLIVNSINAQSGFYYRDDDRDGFGGDITIFIIDIEPPPGYSRIGGDCNDWDPLINPASPEVCNFKDDNCNGGTDEGCHVYYRDTDSDGYGVWDLSAQIREMFQPQGYALVGGDCEPDNPKVHPGAIDGCGNGNEDCDGAVDEDCISFSPPLSNQNKEPAELPAFNISAYPNPGKSIRLYLQGHYSKGKISVRVLDQFGRIVEIRENLTAGQIIQLGSAYGNGAYIVEAVQGTDRKIIQVIKL